MSKGPKTLSLTEEEAFLEYAKGGAGRFYKTSTIHKHYLGCLIMLDAGLRVRELVNLRISDLYFQKMPVKALQVRAAIAKNHRARIVPLTQRVIVRLTMYREMYVDDKQFAPESFFFAEWPYIKPITTRTMQRYCLTVSRKSVGRNVTPHMLRHTFATKLMRVTNSRIVQELLGHENLTSTQVYSHPNSQDLFDSIGKLNP